MTAEHQSDEGARQEPEPSSPTVPQRPARGGRTRRWVLIGLAVVVAIGVLMAGRLHIPYYALSPGSIREAGPLIRLGSGAEDPEAGEIAFATVSVEGRLNLLQALSGWWDGSIDVVDEDLILGGRTQQQSDAVNQILMKDSKDIAIQLALTRLGLATPIGAVVVDGLPGGEAAGDAGPIGPRGQGDGGSGGELQTGDVIVAIAGTPVSTAADVPAALRAAEIGATVEVSVERGAADDRGIVRSETPAQTVSLSVSEHDGGATLPYRLRDAVRSTYEGDVTIDSGQVGGPSAGLAFTLGVIDELTEGDLTGGTKVAATGTIGLDGIVGPIGGIQQKAVAASRAGVQLFLVPDSLPASELEKARRLGKGVELVAVGTLDDALDALADHGGRETALPALRS
ncbi:MAG: PDZ domain-containing protein [Acidimicrobiales bacterium]|nr:PDZ domain-containing protein [Acidimicrobiales bacterium]